ncbi:MAG: flagellar hook-basal body complex protein, partial [Firmicutes bacterium]|nr:flagellar hook-basal body complex protein [Bacillota bacterium]
MMRSMFAGVSGLKAHQNKMDVIGNNIANVNTAGYKSSRATFQEMLSQRIRGASAPTENRGGTNPQQVGLGVSLGSIDVKHTQGNTQSTGYVTDLAIEGDGFFVLGHEENRLYTRAGIFGLDNGTDGNLVSMVNGERVLGYMADRDGNIDTNSALQPLYISAEETISPRATSKVFFAGNLDNRYSLSDDPVRRTVQIFDSRGREQTIIVDLKRPEVENGDEEWDGNAWQWDASWLLISDTIPSHNSPIKNNEKYEVKKNNDGFALVLPETEDVVATSNDGRVWTVEYENEEEEEISFQFETALKTGEILKASGSEGRLVLSAERSLTTELGDEDDDDISGIDRVIRFNQDGSFSGVNVYTVVIDPDDAEAMEIDLDFSAFTQYADTFTGKFINQNGYANGSLESFAIDQNGVIVGSFSNGLTRNLGQVALTRFANPGGLERAGSTMFVETANSGSAQAGGAAGQPGYGIIAPSSLEMSNVDLGEEFTE